MELEYPYDNWDGCSLVINKEPRRNLLLYRKNPLSKSGYDRTTVSYARYLMSVKLGRLLKPSEHVDHINHDKLDDIISNLQILTPRENTVKGIIDKNRGRKVVTLKCGSCDKQFDKFRNLTHLTNKNKKSTYCSRKCSGVKTKPSIVINEWISIPTIDTSIKSKVISYNGKFAIMAELAFNR